MMLRLVGRLLVGSMRLDRWFDSRGGVGMNSVMSVIQYVQFACNVYL
jgi:hypothetical protein